ncbi:TPA: HlyD family secretion protein [Vibrio vulnificus]
MLFTVTIILFLSKSEYARKETVKGYLIPNLGVIKIYANKPGTIDTVYVKDGDFVHKGDMLAKVVLSRTQQDGVDLSESVLSSLYTQKKLLENDYVQTQELTQNELKGYIQKTVDLKLSIAGVERQIDLLSRKHELQIKEHQRYEKLYEKGFISEIDFQKQEKILLSVMESLENASMSKMSLIAQLNETESKINIYPHEVELRLAQISRSKAEVQRKIDEAKNSHIFSVTAKESGVITSISVKEGEFLPTNRPLLSIIPEGAELIAELLLPTRSAGFVELENEARLRFDAFPYQRFGFIESSIIRIDKSLLVQGEADIPLQLSEPVYRVQTKLYQQDIEAYGEYFLLKSGMLLEADIILEKRSLLDWLLDPIYSLRGRLG